jgi:hypothetical protein
MYSASGCLLILCRHLYAACDFQKAGEEMKKSPKKEPLLNRLAREVGHAAGRIAMATQGLTQTDAAPVQAANASGKSKRTSKQRSAAKKKKVAGKSAKGKPASSGAKNTPKRRPTKQK